MAAFLPCKLVQDHAAFLPSYARMTVRKPIWACTPHERRNALSDPPKPKVEGLLDQDRPAALSFLEFSRAAGVYYADAQWRRTAPLLL